jgi:hypothetical protein
MKGPPPKKHGLLFMSPPVVFSATIVTAELLLPVGRLMDSRIGTKLPIASRRYGSWLYSNATDSRIWTNSSKRICPDIRNWCWTCYDKREPSGTLGADAARSAIAIL